MIDSRDINELHPCLKRASVEFVKRCENAGFKAIVTSTYRDHEMQNALFKKGGVTKARGGQSFHNHRLAFDFAPLNFDGKIDWSGKDPNWAVGGNIWQDMGGTWGGSWKGFVDKPHCQYSGGLTIAELQGGMVLAKEAKMPWESKKGESEMVEKISIKIDGNIYSVNRILKDGKNFVELRSLEQAGITVEFDAANNMPVMCLPKQ